MVENENLLERSLRLAANDSTFSPEFYGTLMDSEVFVLGHTDRDEDDKVVDLIVREGEQIHLQHVPLQDGTSPVAFFSSLHALERFIEAEEPYLRLPARAFFEMTLGQDLVLNLGSEYGKFFTPEEIQSLLEDGLPGACNRQVVEEDMQVLIGSPREMPYDIMDVLKRYFLKDAHVSAAWIAMIHMPSSGNRAELCFGIECEESVYEHTCEAAMTTVTHLLSPERTLLAFHVNPTAPEGPGGFMKEHLDPFYRALPDAPPAQSSGPAFGRRRQAPAATPVFGKRR